MQDAVALVVDKDGNGEAERVCEYMSQSDWKNLEVKARSFYRGPFMRVLVEFELPEFKPGKTAKIRMKP